MSSAPMDVTARLRAETAEFDNKMEHSGSVAEATARQIERSSERARAAWQRELVAQDRAEEKAKEVARAKELAALRADILARSLAAEAQATDQATAAAERYGHASVSQLAASSAAVRAFEGNPGIRAVERFLTTIPGVSAAMQAVFPIIGGLAFLDILGQVIGKVKDLYDEFATLKQLAAESAAAMIKEGDQIAETYGATLNLRHETSMRENPLGTIRTDIFEQQQQQQAREAQRQDVLNRLGYLNRVKLSGNYLGYGTSEEEVDIDTQGQQHRLEMINQQIELGKAKIAEMQSQAAAIESKKEKKSDTSAAEATRRAAAAQLKAFEDGMAQLKADHQVSSLEEYNYWTGLEKAASRYPDNLRHVMEQVGAARQAMGRDNERDMRQAVEEQQKAARQEQEIFATLARIDDEYARAQHRAQDATAQLAAVTQRSSDATAEMVIRHEEATGAIGRQAAAYQLAQLHAAGFAAQLEALRQEQANDDADTSLNDEQREANRTKRQAQTVTLQGEAQRTAMQDSWAMTSPTAMQGARQALQEFTAAAMDDARIMKDVIGSTLNGFNQTLLTVMTQRQWQHHNIWRDMGKATFTDVASHGLKKGEGALLGMVGFGDKHQTLGTRANPMWTQDANFANVTGQAPGGSDALSGFASIAAKAAGTFFGIPGFARGVRNFGGGLAMVGEEGPEIVNLPHGADVIPNHKIGGGGMTVHVDARGSSDPAQVEAAVHRGMIAAVQTSVGASHYIAQQDKRRKPAMAGRS